MTLAGVHSWLLGLLISLVVVHAQNPVGGTVKEFKMPLYDSQFRLRSLVSGKSAASIAGGYRIGTLKIENYGTNGAVDMVAEAPVCDFDPKTGLASSDGPFKAVTTNQRMSIEGVGFVFNHADSKLVVSNKVHTMLRRETNAAAAALEKPLEVFADDFLFDMASRVAIYRGNVRAEDAQMNLTCGVLTVRLGTNDNGFQTIEAVGNVVVASKADGSRATSAMAVYDRATDRVLMSGRPSWRQGPREGRAESIVFNRKERAFEADGNVVMKLPREALGQSGLLLSASPSVAATGTNVVAKTPAFVDVFADHFQSRSNLTLARGNVRVVEATNQLTCEVLTLRSATKDSPEETVLAENNVVIAQGNRRVRGARAEYNRTTDLGVISGEPSWKLEQSEGRADTLTFRSRTNYFLVDGHAAVKLFRATNTAAMVPLLPAVTNATTATNSSKFAVQPVEVFADRFEIRDRKAAFSGNVHAHEGTITGAERRMRSPMLEVRFAANSNRVESAVATGGVVMEQGTEGSTNRATVYQRLDAQTVTAEMDLKTGSLRQLTAEKDVIFRSAESFAAGNRLTYDAPTETMRVTEDLFFINNEVMIYDAETWIYDRRTGRYRMEGPFKSIPFRAVNEKAPKPGVEVKPQ